MPALARDQVQGNGQWQQRSKIYWSIRRKNPWHLARPGLGYNKPRDIPVFSYLISNDKKVSYLVKFMRHFKAAALLVGVCKAPYRGAEMLLRAGA